MCEDGGPDITQSNKETNKERKSFSGLKINQFHELDGRVSMWENRLKDCLLQKPLFSWSLWKQLKKLINIDCLWNSNIELWYKLFLCKSDNTFCHCVLTFRACTIWEPSKRLVWKERLSFHQGNIIFRAKTVLWLSISTAMYCSCFVSQKCHPLTPCLWVDWKETYGSVTVSRPPV